MRNGFRRWAVPGALATAGGLLLAVVAVPPTAWADSLGQWADVARPFAPYMIGLFCGLLAGVLLWRPRHRSSALDVLPEADFLQAVRRDINSHNFSVVKVFGYTGEVVGNDIIKYEDRYRADLEVRFLHRDWVVERADEDVHNARAIRNGRRLWNKAAAIREAGTSEWPHAMRRSVRYYVHQPILKAVLMCDADGAAEAVYFSFQQWDPDPGQGGSQFKSVPTTMAFAAAKDGAWQRQLVDRLNSQFEYEWVHGETSAEILLREASSAPPPQATVKSRKRSDKI